MKRKYLILLLISFLVLGCGNSENANSLDNDDAFEYVAGEEDNSHKDSQEESDTTDTEEKESKEENDIGEEVILEEDTPMSDTSLES